MLLKSYAQYIDSRLVLAFLHVCNFLVSQDKYIHGANVMALLSVSAGDAWAKTLTLAITFK